MAEKLRLIDSDVLDANAAVVAAYIDDVIDHLERIAMRLQTQNVADIDGFAAFAVHRPLPDGFGAPANRAPAKRSMITMLPRATLAPSPIATSSATPVRSFMTTKSPIVTPPAIPHCAPTRQWRPIIAPWAM